MQGKVHRSFLSTKSLLASQDKVWDRDYRLRGGIWSKDTRTLPGGLEGLAVLEAGAGNGKTLRAILGQNPKSVSAFDFSPYALRLCGERVERDKRATFEVADIRSLPYTEGTFDAAVIYFVLDNLVEADRELAVGEVFRVLKGGGRVLFADFAAGDFREVTGNVMKRLGEHTILKKNGILCHFFRLDEVAGLFCGFEEPKISVSESTPIRNKNHLLRRTITLDARKPLLSP